MQADADGFENKLKLEVLISEFLKGNTEYSINNKTISAMPWYDPIARIIIDSSHIKLIPYGSGNDSDKAIVINNTDNLKAGINTFRIESDKELLKSLFDDYKVTITPAKEPNILEITSQWSNNWKMLVDFSEKLPSISIGDKRITLESSLNYTNLRSAIEKLVSKEEVKLWI